MQNPVPKKVRDKIEPVVFPVIQKIKLTKPKLTKRDFFSVILNRHSSRVFKKLSLKELSELLWFTSKVISNDVQKNGTILTHRPAPSAGSLHPIDLFVCTEIDGVRNLFYYNPIDHTLGKITTKKRRLTSFLKHVNKVLPYHDASIIWFVANTNKTSAKYQYAESLIWRDAGAYIYCFQIVAEALKLKSCPLGTLGEPFITDLVDANNASHGVGGILVG